MAVAQQVLNILLADTEYSQYLLMKEHLSISNGFRARILWCGEPDQYLHAIQSGIYDLVFMQYDTGSLFILEQLDNSGCHVPVVMMSDHPVESLVTRVCRYGALDMLDRQQPDIFVLRHYLAYADMYRKGELCLNMLSDESAGLHTGSPRHGALASGGVAGIVH